MIQTAHYACRVNLARFSIKWKEARSLSEDACSGLSRANLRRRGRCGSPLKFLHVQARPREIKFNGVSDEDLSYSRTRVYTIHAYTQGCTRCSMRKKPASRRRVYVARLSRQPRVGTLYPSACIYISSRTNCNRRNAVFSINPNDDRMYTFCNCECKGVRDVAFPAIKFIFSRQTDLHHYCDRGIR